jgi:hypothetical protein
MARLPMPPSAAELGAALRPTEDIVALHPATRLVRVFTALGRHPQSWNSIRYDGPLAHGRFDPQRPAEDGGVATDPRSGVVGGGRAGGAPGAGGGGAAGGVRPPPPPPAPALTQRGSKAVPASACRSATASGCFHGGR